MTNRITFDAWGIRGSQLDMPKYAIPRDDEEPAQAVARAIATKNGLAVAGYRPDGTAMRGDLPESQHYEITLGRRLRDGYAVEASLWIAVPA